MNNSTNTNSTTEEAVMNEPNKPITSDNQRGISVTEVLIALATLATTLLVGAMSEPKIPRAASD